MDIILFFVFWGLMTFFVARDAWNAWFKPKKFIETVRKRRHLQLSLLPFLRKISPYPDEGFILQYNKVALPIMVIFFVCCPLSLLLMLTYVSMK